MHISRRIFASCIALLGAAAYTPVSRAAEAVRKRVLSYNPSVAPKPPYSAAVAYRDLVFVSGKASYGAPDPKDIRVCTAYALDEVEKELRNAGSTLEKVLKVQVFLRNIEDYAAMNEVFAARFAIEPPARTTVAAIIPRDSLVEIDSVAYV